LAKRFGSVFCIHFQLIRNDPRSYKHLLIFVVLILHIKLASSLCMLNVNDKHPSKRNIGLIVLFSLSSLSLTLVDGLLLFVLLIFHDQIYQLTPDTSSRE